VQALSVTFGDIQKATRRDTILGKVYRYVQEGWPDKVAEELQPYIHRENKLNVENDCREWLHDLG